MWVTIEFYWPLGKPGDWRKKSHDRASQAAVDLSWTHEGSRVDQPAIGGVFDFGAK